MLRLAVVVALAAAAAAGAAGKRPHRRGEHESRLSLGPVLGDVSSSGAAVWVRADSQPRALQLEWRPSGDKKPYRRGGEVRLERLSDFTGVARLHGLMPGKRYEYRVLLDGEPQAHADQSFERPEGVGKDVFFVDTMPEAGAPGDVTFAFGSCLVFGQRPFHVLDQLAAPLSRPRDSNEPAGDDRTVHHAPHRRVPLTFALLLGDFIYGDVPLSHQASDRQGYQEKYREVLGERHMRAFLARVPTFQIWDDHEVVNNWDPRKIPAGPAGWDAQLAAARAVYVDYVASRSPSPPPPLDGDGDAPRFYYHFAAGGVAVFVCDVRYHRSAEERTFLGAEQLAQLLAWLERTDRDPEVRFRVVASGVAFTTHKGYDEFDTWAADEFRAERNRVLEAVAAGRTGTVLVTADSHFSYVAELRVRAPAGRPPVTVHELSVSPLGTPAIRMTPPMLESSAAFAARAKAADGPGSPVLSERVVARHDEHKAVGVVRLHAAAADPWLKFSVYSEEGDELYGTRLSTGEFLGEAAGAESPPEATEGGEDSEAEGAGAVDEAGDTAEGAGEPDATYTAALAACAAAVGCGVLVWCRSRDPRRRGYTVMERKRRV